MYTVEGLAQLINIQTENVCERVRGYVQALPVAVDEGLEQRFVVGDGLQYVAVTGHIANGPLAQSCTAESEDVTVRER